MFNSWDKNDPKDAEVLLELLKKGIVQRHVEPLFAGHHDLQELSKTYYNVTLSRTRLQHSILNHYRPLHFPEMAKFWCSTRAEWWINYLIRFPTAARVRELSFDEYRTVAWLLVGRKVAKQRKVEELYEIAQRSIGLPIAADSLACETLLGCSFTVISRSTIIARRLKSAHMRSCPQTPITPFSDLSPVSGRLRR